MFREISMSAVEDLTDHWGDAVALPACVAALHLVVVIQLAVAFVFLSGWIALQIHDRHRRAEASSGNKLG